PRSYCGFGATAVIHISEITKGPPLKERRAEGGMQSAIWHVAPISLIPAKRFSQRKRDAARANEGATHGGRGPQGKTIKSDIDQRHVQQRAGYSTKKGVAMLRFARSLSGLCLLVAVSSGPSLRLSNNIHGQRSLFRRRGAAIAPGFQLTDFEHGNINQVSRF